MFTISFEEMGSPCWPSVFAKRDPHLIVSVGNYVACGRAKNKGRDWETRITLYVL